MLLTGLVAGCVFRGRQQELGGLVGSVLVVVVLAPFGAQASPCGARFSSLEAKPIAVGLVLPVFEVSSELGPEGQPSGREGVLLLHIIQHVIIVPISTSAI